MTEKRNVPRISVAFVITMQNIEKRLPFEEISSRLKPSRTRRYEEFPEVSKEMGYAHDIWALEIERKTYDFNSVVEELISELQEQTEYLVELLKDKDISMRFPSSVYMEVGESPYIGLTPETIQYMAKLRGDFLLDLYIDYEDE